MCVRTSKMCVHCAAMALLLHAPSVAFSLTTASSFTWDFSTHRMCRGGQRHSSMSHVIRAGKVTTPSSRQALYLGRAETGPTRVGDTKAHGCTVRCICGGSMLPALGRLLRCASVLASAPISASITPLRRILGLTSRRTLTSECRMSDTQKHHAVQGRDPVG